ncbi:MAG: bifunctional aspartate kinase/homoserine dehydrogenase I [Balneolaceae bacterium]
MRVLKFGGTSVANVDSIRRVVETVLSGDQKKQVIVVVSAFGGVTDDLLDLARHASEGGAEVKERLKKLEDRHVGVIRSLLNVKKQSDTLTRFKMLMNELEDVLQGVSLTRELTRRTTDFILGFGERFSALIISHCLQNEGVAAEFVDARELIQTDARYGQAKVLLEPTCQRVESFFEKRKGISVVTGFIASTPNGVSTTLGRGGSDYTVSLIGAILKVKQIEIWTDVDGLMTADPSMVKRAFPIREVSYEEAMELSHFGAKVIYPPTIQPALQARIPIVIRNTFHPELPGTVISETSGDREGLIRGLSSISDVSLITLKGSGMIGVSGVSGRMFSTLAREQINIILITQASSEHTVTVGIQPEHATRAKRSLEKEFRLEIQEGMIDEVRVEKDLSIIAAVGDNMRQIPGIAGRVFSALGRNGVNIVAISQGSSERNISFVVSRKDEKKALNTLHDAFFMAGVKTVHLFLVGVGLIGSKLLELFENQIEVLYDKYLLDIRLKGVANSEKMLLCSDEESIGFSSWREQLESEGRKSSLKTFVREMKACNLPNSVFVDCTASQEVSEIYPEVLSSSISVVTPNKIANSSSMEYYDELKSLAARHNAAFRYETNVGAGLPVVATIHELVTTGDSVHRIEGVLSGTLSYIFNSYNGEMPFSEIVRQAREKGFTEPDPREDLNGHDVGRKLLILIREAGYRMEFDDLDIENLVPKGARNAGSVEQFFEVLKEFDGEFSELLNSAADQGKKLCYIARFEGGKASVKLEEIDRDHPFYGLAGSDNIFALYTDHYLETPMVVKGPGAGANVTAGGIVADILRVANTKARSNDE